MSKLYKKETMKERIYRLAKQADIDFNTMKILYVMYINCSDKELIGLAKAMKKMALADLENQK